LVTCWSRTISIAGWGSCWVLRIEKAASAAAARPGVPAGVNYEYRVAYPGEVYNPSLERTRQKRKFCLCCEGRKEVLQPFDKVDGAVYSIENTQVDEAASAYWCACFDKPHQ
jgi:hypothetical protein